MAFSPFQKKILNSNFLVFFDFEGTQFSHKAIALAFVGVEKEMGTLLPKKDGKVIQYHTLIQCQDEIGSFVENLTDIHPSMLQQAKPFHQVVLEVTKLLRPYKRMYFSYGNSDIFMLHNTMDKEDETELNFFNNVTHNYVDMQSFLQKRIVDHNGRCFSLAKLRDLFSIHVEGKEHDPLYDSEVLYQIYQAYIENKERVMELVLENYAVNSNTKNIDKEITSILLQKGEASLDTLKGVIEKHL